ADLVDLDRLDAIRARSPTVDVLQGEEECLGHVFGGLAGDPLSAGTALDAACGVEVDLRTLHGGVQDGPRRRHRRTLELLLQQRRERRQDRGQRWAGRCATGDLVAL